MANTTAYKSNLLHRFEYLGERLNGSVARFGRMTPQRKRIVFIIAVVLLLVLAATWWRTRGNGGASFVTVPVKRGNVVATITAAGTIEPLEVVDVGAQVAGQISSFGTDNSGKQVDYRSVVKQGDVLAKIDDSVYAADLAVAKGQLARDKAGEISAQANLEQTKAKFALADADWKRMQTLSETKVASRAAYDTAMIYAWADFVNVCQLQFNEQEEAQEIGALQDRAEAERESEPVSKLNLPPVSFDSIRYESALLTLDV